MVKKKRLTRSLMDDRFDRVNETVNKAKRRVNRSFFGEQDKKDRLQLQRIANFMDSYNEHKKSDKSLFKKELHKKLKENNIIVKGKNHNKNRAFHEILKNMVVQKLKKVDTSNLQNMRTSRKSSYPSNRSRRSRMNSRRNSSLR